MGEGGGSSVLTGYRGGGGREGGREGEGGRGRKEEEKKIKGKEGR